jgi:hypothetical protein
VVATCELCGEALEGDGPAVVQFLDMSEVMSWAWVSFLEDWRGGLTTFIHPVCFAEAKGLPALLELVTRRERINRDGFWKLIQERDDLREGR